jgi:carbon-monoxide dehydrogenase small subunit
MFEPKELVEINTVINGQKVQKRVSVRMHLADFLRSDLGLNGVHLGCEHGVCGACTILVDDLLVRACLMLAVQIDGCRIETIEGAVESGRVAQIVAAFQQRNAAQCGFCSPAMVLTASELVKQKLRPSRDQIREGISGNYCRCTGYQSIVDAIEDIYDGKKLDQSL